MEDLKKKIQNYLIIGILATLFCWPPIGVIAVVFAGKANTYIALDNPAKAMMAAEKAKFWGAAAVIIGIFSYLAAWITVAL